MKEYIRCPVQRAKRGANQATNLKTEWVESLWKNKLEQISCHQSGSNQEFSIYLVPGA